MESRPSNRWSECSPLCSTTEPRTVGSQRGIRLVSNRCISHDDATSCCSRPRRRRSWRARTCAELDLRSLAQYVVFQFTLGHRTMFDGVERIPPATYVEGRGDVIIAQHRYWIPATNIDIEDEDDVAGLVRQVLDDSVRMQLRSDVPLGGYLSGGLDSSVVCALAARHTDQRLKVFHGRFAEGVGYDESHYAKLLATEIGAELQVVTPSLARFHRSDAGDDSIARRAGRRPRGVSAVHGQQTGFTGSQGRPRRPRRR